jgi:hypothetical protein
MARATKNSISGGLLGSDPQMTGHDANASTLLKDAARWPMRATDGRAAQLPDPPPPRANLSDYARPGSAIGSRLTRKRRDQHDRS